MDFLDRLARRQLESPLAVRPRLQPRLDPPAPMIPDGFREIVEVGPTTVAPAERADEPVEGSRRQARAARSSSGIDGGEAPEPGRRALRRVADDMRERDDPSETPRGAAAAEERRPHARAAERPSSGPDGLDRPRLVAELLGELRRDADRDRTVSSAPAGDPDPRPASPLERSDLGVRSAPDHDPRATDRRVVPVPPRPPTVPVLAREIRGDESDRWSRRQPSVVTVSIGRIEVRTSPPPAAPRVEPRPTSAMKPALTLEAYLEQRHGAVHR